MPTPDYTVRWLKEDYSGRFEILYKALYRRLYIFARNFLMDDALAEDAVQEVFASLWRRSGRMPDDMMLEFYLFTAVKNTCIDHFRKMNVVDRHLRHLVTVQAFSAYPFEPGESERESRARMVLGELSDMQRRVVEMSVVEGMKYKEVAAVLGISEGTVHTHIKRAYKYFKARFAQLCVAIIPYLYIIHKIGNLNE